jgi:branched-chain amino acid transport system ATP-binding protein
MPRAATTPDRAPVDGAADGLRVRDVYAWYGQTQVLFGVNIDVGPREIVGLLGHNGSGKSTVLRVLAGLHRRAEYDVTLGGESLAHLAPHVIARRGLVLVRGAEVFEGISVEEHLVLGARLGRISGRKAMKVEEIYELMPVLGKFRKRLGPELSGGQRQLLALGMAFAANPRCMILDEPSTGLDVVARRGIAEVLTAFSSRGVPLLIVEQNPTWLAEFADRAYLLELGRVIAEGSVLSLLGAGSTRRGEDALDGADGAATSPTGVSGR